LLEINETLVEREKTVARELDLAKGLQHETLLKLNSTNRKLKSIEEQLSEKDGEIEKIKKKFEEELEEKVGSHVHYTRLCFYFVFIKSILEQNYSSVIDKSKASFRTTTKEFS
jgi:F0F1-type ATP synthase membrane subunit b/b'